MVIKRLNYSSLLSESVAAPIAKNIILSVIDYKGYKPVPNELLKEYLWLDTKYILLEDVTGLDLQEAKKRLKSFRVEYSGNGTRIIAQSPRSNTFVKEGSIVKIMLN